MSQEEVKTQAVAPTTGSAADAGGVAQSFKMMDPT